MDQLLQQQITILDPQNGISKLLGYNFNIVYKLGIDNMWVDALSREKEDAQLQFLAYYYIW